MWFLDKIFSPAVFIMSLPFYVVASVAQLAVGAYEKFSALKPAGKIGLGIATIATGVAGALLLPGFAIGTAYVASTVLGAAVGGVVGGGLAYLGLRAIPAAEKIGSVGLVIICPFALASAVGGGLGGYKLCQKLASGNVPAVKVFNLKALPQKNENKSASYLKLAQWPSAKIGHVAN